MPIKFTMVTKLVKVKVGGGNKKWIKVSFTMILHIMVNQNLKKLKAKVTTRRKTPFFNYVFNYFSIVIYSFKTSLSIEKCFLQFKNDIVN
jgi:hypothetical protein